MSNATEQALIDDMKLSFFGQQVASEDQDGHEQLYYACRQEAAIQHLRREHGYSDEQIGSILDQARAHILVAPPVRKDSAEVNYGSACQHD